MKSPNTMGSGRFLSYMSAPSMKTYSAMLERRGIDVIYREWEEGSTIADSACVGMPENGQPVDLSLQVCEICVYRGVDF